MPPLQTYGERPVVLLTNDDGPPCDASPNIYSFAHALERQLGWDVRVVIPDSQKSWVGKAYAINDVITASYFYPQGPDGRTGEVTHVPRPLKHGESMEWVLLSGTPSSCANIALHNLYPGEIDLVISGPNHGRNSSTAFALSSGTVGAALAATLSVPLPGPPAPAPGPPLHTEHVPCIALSYAVVARPVAPRLLALAAETAVDVCKRLFDNWAHDSAPGRAGKVQLYSVNVPLVEQYLEKGSRKAVYTELWKNAYGSLFKPTTRQVFSCSQLELLTFAQRPHALRPRRRSRPRERNHRTPAKQAASRPRPGPHQNIRRYTRPCRPPHPILNPCSSHCSTAAAAEIPVRSQPPTRPLSQRRHLDRRN
ncbi:5'/3'-nucleotidase SurE [Cryptococcus gattii Ru294]|nr:5'/3'-nucleotidase SurE [Cryptococcus gattii Ru294]